MASKKKAAPRVAASVTRKARAARASGVEARAPAAKLSETASTGASASGGQELNSKTAPRIVEEAFRMDESVRAVIDKNTKARVTTGVDNLRRVRDAFANFEPSRFSAAERKRRNYLSPNGSLAETTARIVDKGVETMQAQKSARGIRLHVSPKVKEIIEADDSGGNTTETISLNAVLALGLGFIQTHVLKEHPLFTTCAAEAAVDARMAQIEGAQTPLVESGGAGPAQPAATSDAHTASDAATAALVSRQVNIQMATARSPEEKLGYNVQNRANAKDTEANVESFELRKGASDVTSYHDFHYLQIAFDYVWDELFDGDLATLGKQLYSLYVDLEEKMGLPVTGRVVTSIADLRKLMDDIRELSDLAEKTSPLLFKGINFSALGDYFPGLKRLAEQQAGAQAAEKAKAGAEESAPTAIEGATRLSTLLTRIESMLSAGYSFDVFAKDSVNFGIAVTYRQTWKPEKYQVGDLVSTIPLAPREVRRYTTRQVVKKTRAQKELDETLRNTRTEVGETSRVESDIVERMQNRENFSTTAQGSTGSDETMKFTGTINQGNDQSKSSEEAKKNIREGVLKSAQEYRQQHRMEVDTTVSEETESTTFHEIQNPNDELTVTYLLYELQRVYRISERIHKLTPVVLIANEMPEPHTIDDAWLIAHDWILRRVILDDSFRPALDYLTKSFVGAELNIQILDNNAKAQKQIVDGLKQQVEAQIDVVERDQRNLENAVRGLAQAEQNEGMLNTVKRIFDPIGLTGRAEPGIANAAQEIVDFSQAAVDRAEREKQRLLQQLGVASTALQVAIDKLSAAVKEHYDRVAEIERLRIHVKANILHYMQAIWMHEPPDQRFFRIYDKPVPIIMPADTNAAVSVTNGQPTPAEALQNQEIKIARLPSDVTVTTKQLVEVADLDRLLGFKGNFSIFPLTQNNYITLHMMQNYLEFSDEVRLRDPDDYANYTVEQLQQIAACLFKRNPTVYNDSKTRIRQMIKDRLTSGRAEDDRVIVPTKSLYIEALVGTHPLLEDYKLVHRALDVKKVQAEVRHAELENVRLAARALRGKDEDPDIEKKIIIEGAPPAVAVTPDV